MSEEQVKEIPAPPFKNPLAAAWRKGYQARLSENEGKKAFNPYPDVRTTNGKNSITYSRSFRNAWERGYDDAKRAEGV